MHLTSITASHKFTTSHQSSEQCVLRVLERRLLISTATDLWHLKCRLTITIREHVHLPASKHLAICRTELRDIPVRCSISLRLLLDPGMPSWLHISSSTHSIFMVALC